MVHKVQQVQQEPKVLLDLKVYLVFREPKVQLDLKELQEHKEQ